jgi:hypothetical protein
VSLFKVYAYSLPKVSDAGESSPPEPPLVGEFAAQGAAMEFAARQVERYERVVTTEVVESGERLVDFVRNPPD